MKLKSKNVKSIMLAKLAIASLLITLNANANIEFQVRGDAIIPVDSCTNENINKNLNAAIEAATTVALVRAGEKCAEQDAIFIRQNYIGTSCVSIMDGQSSAVSANVVPHFECRDI